MEGELVTLALVRIKQDPSQFDLFIDMLRDTEGMDLIVTTLTGGELKCSTYTYYNWSCEHCTRERIPTQGRQVLEYSTA